MSKRESMFLSLPVFLLAFSAAPACASGTVWVTKSDGSLQCDEGKEKASAERLALAKKTLEKAGVKVLEAKTRNDGAMRAQACGFPTGNETALQIPKKDAAKAKGLGFQALP